MGPIQFASVTRARENGRREAIHGGAVIYTQTGEPEFDAWGDPELIEKLGALPPEQP